MIDTSKLIGYARVSTEEQDLSVQVEALLQAGVHKDDIYTDKMSGVSERRMGFDLCMRRLRKGDALIIWKLDRLGRSVMGIINITESLMKREIDLKIITEPYDTTTPIGKAFLHISAAFAQLERDLISERTKAALDLKRKRGEKMGAKPKITEEIWNLAVAQRVLGKSFPKIAAHAKKTLGYKGKQNAFYTYKDLIDAGAPYPWLDKVPAEDNRTDWAET